MRKFLLFIFILPSIVFSQVWIDKMQDPNNNFYDTQREFEEYWNNKAIEKGKGWKQFRRWENFIKPRVYPDGTQHPEILFEEYNNLIELNNQFLMNPPNIWEQVGPDDVPIQSNGNKRGIGRVNSIAFHPNDQNTLYIGAPAGGFWKSTNHGQNWTTTTDFLTNLGVSDIAINPINPDEIFIITGDRDGGDTYSYGLMKSNDGGNTFNTTGLSFNITNYYRGNRVILDPINPNIVIVSTSNGIYRSTDSGVTFNLTYSSVNMTDIEFHPTNSNIIYGASKGNTSVYKSSDNGINWSQSGTGLPNTNDVVRACVAVTLDNPQAVYALFGGNNNGFYAVYKSLDEGLSWTQQANSPNLLGWDVNGSDSDGQAWYDLAFAVSPNNENTLFVGGVNCWKSTDGGQNWTINTHWYGAGGTSYMHADEHMLHYNKLNNNIYSANDGGLYFSNDDGNSWTDISDGLHITQFYSLGVSQTVQDKIITGAQDNGTFLKNNLNWDPVIGGDGMECIIDYTNSNIMYGALYYGDVRKSTNGGNSFSAIGPANNGAWETPYELDKNDPNIIYIGYDELQKSLDGGNSWNQITNGETNGGKIDEIGLSKSNSNVIFISDGNDIYRTLDGGTNWTQVNNNLPNKYISYIIVHPSDENKVWVTLSGYTSSEKVYKSTDGGDNWVNISGTLPNIPINCIELDKSDVLETIYIGTDLGVFSTDSTLSDWNLFGNNLPHVIVNELEIQYQSNKLFAATYGRGLWSIDLEITSPPTANFSYNDSVFCSIPADVSFINNSYYSNSYYWDFGDGNTSTQSNPVHTYNSFGTFSVQLIAVGPLGTDSIIKQQIISIDQTNFCITTLPISGSGNTQTQCTGTMYDVGGPTGNYYDQNDSWMTISPPGSNQITLTFNSFDIEAPSSSTNCNWDYLEIFDGPNLTSPSLGQYCNALTGSPGTITSSGGSVTILLHSDQSVNGSGFEADWTCTYPTSPPVTSFNFSDSVSCNSTIFFNDLSTNGPISWLWDFGDGSFSTLQNPVHTYQTSGFFNVKLITSNSFGSDSLIINNAIYVIDFNLQSQNDTACGFSSLNLTANSSSGNVVWFDDINLTNIVGTGNVFSTPVINFTTAFYAQSIYDFSPVIGGPLDNSIGSGGYYNNDRHLFIDCYESANLVSVDIYANTSQSIVFELRDNNSQVIEDTTIFVQLGLNTLFLDFDMPAMNNLELGIGTANADLYRNSSGANYPYNIGNIASITGHNSPNSANYHYFFYNIAIKKESCSSNIEEVFAVIETNTNDTTNIISCGSYLWNNDNILYNTSGTYTNLNTLPSGCVNTSVLNLTIDNNITNVTNEYNCGSYFWPVNGITYDSTGIFSTIITDSLGCVTEEILNLTIDSSTFSSYSVNVCDTYLWTVNGNSYNSSGTYLNISILPSGCTQTDSLSLIINNSTSSTQSFNICDGDSIEINGLIYNSPGNYQNITQNINGCDSIINTIISVQPLINNYQNVLLCDGDSILIGSNTYFEDGIYIDTIISSNGCDSIVSSEIEISNLELEIFYSNGELAVNTINGVINDYLWSNGLVTSSINPLENGIYWCVGTNSYGCFSDTAFYNFSNTASIDNPYAYLNIFPNPTNSIINILFTNNQNTTITVENILGEELYSTLCLEKGSLTKQIDLSSFSNGVYIIKLSNKLGIINKKIILE